VELQKESAPRAETFKILMGDEDAGWLGVQTQEVTAETVKEFKLPAERGVVLQEVTADSPAAKAGLKEHDVVTEIDGQRVQGTAQFRRMIHEIPAGRTVQLTVWRNGQSQNIATTLGKAEEAHSNFFGALPSNSYSFRMPDMPEVEIPRMNFGPMELFTSRPRLGVDVEDIDGQLGTYFGVPEGEGVLVRSVNAGSSAEKAGVKAGDVITSVNSERIRSVGDLREKLAAKHEEKSAKLGILRNKSEMNVTVELPAPEKKKAVHLNGGVNI
jgi:serine protease Do